MTAKAWFKLVEPESKWDKVSLGGIQDVADIKKAIKAEMTPELDNYPAARLAIKATKEDKDANHAVELDEEDDLQSILWRFGIEDRPSIPAAFAKSIRLFASVPLVSDVVHSPSPMVKRTIFQAHPDGTNHLDLSTLFALGFTNGSLSVRLGMRYKRPIPLIRDDDEGLQWEYQPHQRLYSDIMPDLRRHFDAHKGQTLGKTLAPPYFFLSGSGTGKSRNAMEFHDTLKKCAIELEMTDLRSRLEKARVFLISLENGMGIKSGESDLTKAIGSRMLLQLLPGNNLNAILREYDSPTPIDVFEWVAKGENEDFSTEFTGILVLDGVQKLLGRPEDAKDKGSQFYRMLDDLCDLSLNSDNSFLISCFTSTVAIPIMNFLATTSRPHVNLEVASLKPPTLKQDNSPVLEADPFSRLPLGDCGGHGTACLAPEPAIDAKGGTVKGPKNSRERTSPGRLPDSKRQRTTANGSPSSY